LKLPQTVATCGLPASQTPQTPGLSISTNSDSNSDFDLQVTAAIRIS